MLDGNCACKWKLFLLETFSEVVGHGARDQGSLSVFGGHDCLLGVEPAALLSEQLKLFLPCSPLPASVGCFGG